MRYFLIIYLVSIVTDLTAGDVVFDLRKGNNLLWLYQSGLRPRYGTDPTSLEAKNQKVQIVLPDAQIIKFDVVWMKIYVMGDERLFGMRMDIKGDYDVDAARKICKSYSTLLGPSKEDFEKFAKETMANERGFTRGIFGSRKWGIISVEWNVSPNMFSSTPFSFSIEINWDWPDNDRPSRYDPLKPPPGFEQFSMERDSVHPAEQVPSPKFVELTKPEKSEARPTAQYPTPVEKVYKQPEPTKATPQTERWPVIVAVLLCISAFLFYRFKTKNPASPK